jgi:hypothetical protein
MNLKLEILFSFPENHLSIDWLIKSIINLPLNDNQHHLDQSNNEQHKIVSYILVHELIEHRYSLISPMLVVELENFRLDDMIEHLLQLLYWKLIVLSLYIRINLSYRVIFSCNQGVSSSWTLAVDGNGERLGAKLNIQKFNVFYGFILHLLTKPFNTYLFRTIDAGRWIEIIEFWMLLKSSLNDESVSSLLSAAAIVCADLW